MPPQSDNYRIRLDEEWLLSEFYEFPHVYFQVYSVLAALTYYDEAAIDLERFHTIFIGYPWTGGYSAVNFYNGLYNNLPRSARPKVTAIQYSSPGFIDLALWVGIAVSLRKIVASFVEAGQKLNTLYTEIHRGLYERKFLRLDVKQRELQLTEAEFNFVRRSTAELAEGLDFDKLTELQQVSVNDLAVLKILLSIYRRVRVLAKYVNSGQVKL